MDLVYQVSLLWNLNMLELGANFCPYILCYDYTHNRSIQVFHIIIAIIVSS